MSEYIDPIKGGLSEKEARRFRKLLIDTLKEGHGVTKQYSRYIFDDCLSEIKEINKETIEDLKP